MTKTFCDVCGREVFGDNKFNVSLENGNNEFDVCYECRKAFEKARNEADKSVYKSIRNN